MNFWDWINKDYIAGERFGYSKRVFISIVIFFIVPLLIYLIVVWDIANGIDEEGEPTQLGHFIILGLYWIGAYISYKRHQAKSRLNQLLDKLLEEDDKDVDHLFKVLKKGREMHRKDRYPTIKGDDRVKWFGIK